VTNHRLSIDLNLLSAAVSRSSDIIGLRAEVGYLNVTSGTIRFPRSIAERDRLEANPDEWVEIPKYHRKDAEGRAAFVREFLQEHGIARSSLQ